MKQQEDPMVVLRAIVLWDYNVDPRDKMRAMFPDHEQGVWYEEKLDLIKKLSFSAWIGQFDYHNQCRVVELALAQYGDQARNWVKTNEDYYGPR